MLLQVNKLECFLAPSLPPRPVVSSMLNLFRTRRTNNARLPAETRPLVEQGRRQGRRICRSPVHNDQVDRELQDLPRFGPLYSPNEDLIFKEYKTSALRHVSTTTQRDHSETEENYSSAVSEIEAEAKDTYNMEGRVGMRDIEFREMMYTDGCFLLQLIISILGGTSSLGYPRDHSVFGRLNRNEARKWLRSILYVGNQIPLVVLRKLMEQEFFEQVLAGIRRWEEPKDLLKRALYELLLIPSAQTRNSCWQISFPITASQGQVLSRNFQSLMQQSSDLLDSLYSFVVGDRNNSTDSEGGLDIDLELGGDDDDDDYYAGDDDREFPSAIQLRQAGIHFKNVKGMGSRGIYLKSHMFYSTLCLPTLKVDENTEMMFQSLKSYEMVHQPNQHKRDLCAYLKLMSELIRSPEDVKILASQGVIDADRIHKDRLPKILSRLAEGESCRKFRHLRLQINEYSQPRWGKVLKQFLSIVLLLTAVQTTFTILSYVHDLHNSAKRPPSPA